MTTLWIHTTRRNQKGGKGGSGQGKGRETRAFVRSFAEKIHDLNATVASCRLSFDAQLLAFVDSLRSEIEFMPAERSKHAMRSGAKS
jgi:hypothetical protein